MRLVVAFVVALAVLPPGSSYAASETADPGATGPYAIGHTSFLVVDATRNVDTGFGGRPVPVNVWYPVDPSAIQSDTPRATYALDPPYGNLPASTSTEWEQFGMAPAYEQAPAAASKPFPLVVISPGWTNDYYQLLFYAERLASHGFVAAVVQHYRDGLWSDEFWDPLDVALYHRPRDVAFMLDALLARNGDTTDVLFGSVRPDFVAASGHSLGGYAAFAMAGGDDQVCAVLGTPFPNPCNSLGTTVPDPRIKAIVTFDGSNQLLHFSELARITVPSLVVGRAWEQAGNWLARAHAAIASHPNYRADIRNSLHPSFTNNCTTYKVFQNKGLITLDQLNNLLAAPWCATALDQREVDRLAAKYAIAFLKTQLAGETGYQQILTPGWALTMETDVEFFVTEPKNATSLGEDPATFLYFLHQPGSLTERAEKDPSKAAVPEPIEP